MVEDLTGKKFGRLTVLSLHHKKQNFFNGIKNGNSYFWLCRCECGNETIVNAHALRTGNTLSCGCIWHNNLIKRNTTHNLSKTRLYHIWQGTKRRCFNKNDENYKDYGGRGIKVCDEWQNSFIAFRDWAIVNGYADNLTIDRIDANGNYEPSNCRWVTMEIQSYNKRNTRYVKYQGQSITLNKLSKITNYNINFLRSLYEKNFDFEKLDNYIKKTPKRQLTFRGETHSITEWANILNLKRGTIKTRLKRGWTIDKALGTPC